MPSKAVFDIARIRAAARARADATSRRAAATEIGMSLTGFLAFLKGGKPHPRTREKLVEWYVEQHAMSRRGGEADVGDDDAEAAIELLVRYIEANGRSTLSAKRRAMVAERLFSTNR